MLGLIWRWVNYHRIMWTLRRRYERAKLLERLKTQPMQPVGEWKRDDLYNDESN